MKLLRLLPLLVVLGVSTLSAKQHTPLTREVREIRAAAVDSLSSLLPQKMIKKDLFEDAYNFIEKELDPKTHEKLLGLQERAELLYAQHQAMLEIPGMNEESPEVNLLDKQIMQVEKELDNLIYNGGVVHWKTMVALASGIGVGAFMGSGKPWLEVAAKSGRAKKFVVNGFTRGILWCLTVTLILEWALRGRRAVLAGNFASGVKFVFKNVTKFFTNLFGDFGWAEKAVAWMERQLRGVGKKLDGVFKGAGGPALAIGTGVVLVGGVLMYRRKGRGDGDAASAVVKA